MEKKFKRRQVIIKKEFQFRYIAFVFLSVLFAAVLVAWDIYYTIGRVIVSKLNHPEIYPLILAVNTQIIGKLFLYLILVVIIAIFVSHRIAGPVYRFEKTAEVLSAGDFTHRVRLRQGDELQELAKTLNSMIEKIQAKIINEKDKASECINEISELEQLVQQTNLANKDKLLQQLQNIKSKLQQVGTEFKTSITTPQK